jgi:hypothetical protein
MGEQCVPKEGSVGDDDSFPFFLALIAFNPLQLENAISAS